jgi:poly(A) polymerase
VTLEAARAAILTPQVVRLLGVLDAVGAQTRVVGGAVRNALLGTPVADFDLATTQVPQAASALAKAAGWKVVPTGLEHGTITVVIEGRPYEVTTLREDIATNGRHAEVRFGTDFRQDAARRDFTINAMSMGLDGVLSDYFGGLEDLAARRVRFIGDARQRLHEDYLRGLRFLRFSATYGAGALDSEGLAAVVAARAGFARLSRERVRQEVLKLLMAPRVLTVLCEAENAGLVSEIIGLPVDITRLEARLALGEADGVARVFSLCVKGPREIEHLRGALKLSNHELKTLEMLHAALARFAGQPPAAMRALAADYPAVAREAVMQLGAEAGADFIVQGLAAMTPMPVFQLTGKDAAVLGVAAGPEMGAVLAKARALWMHRGCLSSHDAQLECLKAAMTEA